MRARFQINLQFREPQRNWIQESVCLTTVINVFSQVGLLAGFRYYTNDTGASHQPLLVLDDFIRGIVAKGEEPIHSLVADLPIEGEYRNLPALDVIPSGHELSVRFIAGQGDWQAYPDFLKALADLMKYLYDALHTEIFFGPEIELSILDGRLPHLRPLRSHLLLGSPFFVLSGELQEQYPNAIEADVSKISNALPSENMTRLFHHDLVIVYWQNFFSDPARMRQINLEQEKWLTDTLNLPIDSRYNEQGDLRVSVYAASSTKHLTFLDPGTDIGYKAMVMSPDGSFDNDVLAELTLWLQAGKLPDEKVVKKIYIILPNRNSAIQLYEKAQPMGLHVLYADQGGAFFWNPFPPGDWLDYPIQGAR